MARFNRFGAVYGDVMAMYPGTGVTDYDSGGANGQAKIEAALDRAVREISGAFTPEVYEQIMHVDAEQVARYATAGQSTFTCGLNPVLAGTLHVWVFPSTNLLNAPGGWGTYMTSYLGAYEDYFIKPRVGILEVPSGQVALTASTGGVVLSGVTVNVNDRIYATYDVDVDNATFAMKSCADAAIMGAAAELGASLYSSASQEWKLVETYREKFRGIPTDKGYKGGSLEGNWVPDELRKLTFFQEVERTSNQVGSYRMRRS